MTDETASAGAAGEPLMKVEEYEYLSECFTYKNHELLQALARGDSDKEITRLRAEFAAARKVMDDAHLAVNGIDPAEAPDLSLRDYAPATDVQVRANAEARAEFESGDK